MAPEDVKIVARRDPGVHGGPLDKEDVTQNWQRVLREFLLHDGPLHKELEDSAHKFVKTGGCTNLNFALSTLMDTAWSVSVLVLEALEAKRLPAMVTEAFSGDVSFRVRYEQLLKKFNQCRGNYLEEITSLRSVNLQKCRPGESLDDLYKRHLDIFHFVPESALTDDELPYFQQAVEECVRLAVLNTENPSRLQRKELEEQLASTKDQLEQAVERIHDLEDELRSERGQKRADKDVQQMVKSLKSNQKKELAEREAQIEELLGNLKKGEEKIHQMRLRLKQASLDDTDLATIKTESLWKTINQDASLQVQLDEKEAQRKALQERVLELERNAQRAAQDLEFVRNQNEEKDAQLGKSTALLKEKDGELQKARELLVAGEGEVERLTRQQPGGSKSSTVAGAGRGLRRSDSKRMVSKKLEGKSPRASRRNSGASPSLSPEGPASPALSRGRGAEAAAEPGGERPAEAGPLVAVLAVPQDLQRAAPPPPPPSAAAVAPRVETHSVGLQTDFEESEGATADEPPESPSNKSRFQDDEHALKYYARLFAGSVRKESILSSQIQELQQLEQEGHIPSGGSSSPNSRSSIKHALTTPLLEGFLEDSERRPSSGDPHRRSSGAPAQAAAAAGPPPQGADPAAASSPSSGRSERPGPERRPSMRDSQAMKQAKDVSSRMRNVVAKLQGLAEGNSAMRQLETEHRAAIAALEEEDRRRQQHLHRAEASTHALIAELRAAGATELDLREKLQRSSEGARLLEEELRQLTAALAEARQGPPQVAAPPARHERRGSQDASVQASVQVPEEAPEEVRWPSRRRGLVDRAAQTNPERAASRQATPFAALMARSASPDADRSSLEGDVEAVEAYLAGSGTEVYPFWEKHVEQLRALLQQEAQAQRASLVDYVGGLRERLGSPALQAHIDRLLDMLAGGRRRAGQLRHPAVSTKCRRFRQRLRQHHTDHVLGELPEVRGPPCESGRGEATLERAASAPGLHPPRGRVSGAAAMGAPLGGHVAAAEARPPRPRRQVALGGVEARGHGSLLPLPDQGASWLPKTRPATAGAA